MYSSISILRFESRSSVTLRAVNSVSSSCFGSCRIASSRVRSSSRLPSRKTPCDAVARQGRHSRVNGSSSSAGRTITSVKRPGYLGLPKSPRMTGSASKLLLDGYGSRVTHIAGSCLGDYPCDRLPWASVYEAWSNHVPVRDKDSIRCQVCGEELISWNGSTTYTAKLVERHEPAVGGIKSRVDRGAET